MDKKSLPFLRKLLPEDNDLGSAIKHLTRVIKIYGNCNPHNPGFDSLMPPNTQYRVLASHLYAMGISEEVEKVPDLYLRPFDLLADESKFEEKTVENVEVNSDLFASWKKRHPDSLEVIEPVSKKKFILRTSAYDIFVEFLEFFLALDAEKSKLEHVLDHEALSTLLADRRAKHRELYKWIKLYASHVFAFTTDLSAKLKTLYASTDGRFSAQEAKVFRDWFDRMFFLSESLRSSSMKLMIERNLSDAFENDVEFFAELKKSKKLWYNFQPLPTVDQDFFSQKLLAECKQLE